MSRRRPTVLLSVLLSLAAAPPLAAQPRSGDPRSGVPGAYELLAEVRKAYAGLDGYRDIGEIERVVDPRGAGERVSMWFETAAGGGALRWDLWVEGEEEASRQVLWRAGGEAFHYDGLRRQWKPVPSLAAALARILGPGSLDVLAVPLVLAGSEEALADPEAASVAGPAICDPEDTAGGDAPGDGDRRRCWIVSLSRMGGAVAARLWVDREAFLVRRLEVEIEGAGEGFEKALGEAGLAAGGGFAGRAMSFRVEHLVEAAGVPVAPDRLAFLPPDGARRVEEWEEGTAAAVDAAGGGTDELPEHGFYDEITVALHTFTARIVDSRGDPVRGLSPQDLVVRAGGREIPVTALDWVSSLPAEPDEEAGGTPALPADEESGGTPAPPTVSLGRLSEIRREPAGQLVVLFVQADFEPTVARGHMRLLPAIEELLAGLPAADRVAVVAFYRHLELLCDFTRDREAAVAALERAIRPGARAFRRRSAAGALSERFDFREAQRATSPERALELVAEALETLPGEKAVIYLGWSLGRLSMGLGVSMTPDYLPALRALDAARATVFVLDVTEADWHALEVGLQQVAADTGGTYARTFRFTAQAAHRLARTIAGHYVVTIDRSAVPEARGRLRVALRQGKGTVHYKPVLLR